MNVKFGVWTWLKGKKSTICCQNILTNVFVKTLTGRKDPTGSGEIPWCLGRYQEYGSYHRQSWSPWKRKEFCYWKPQELSCRLSQNVTTHAHIQFTRTGTKTVDNCFVLVRTYWSPGCCCVFSGKISFAHEYLDSDQTYRRSGIFWISFFEFFVFITCSSIEARIKQKCNENFCDSYRKHLLVLTIRLLFW